MHAGAAERIHAHANAGTTDRIEIDSVAQIADVCSQEIVPVGRRCALRLFQRDAPHILQPSFENCVGVILNPAGDRGIGGAAVGRVVLESTIVRRIVRRRDHDAVGESALAATVVAQDRV